jgi:hypothetical protein
MPLWGCPLHEGRTEAASLSGASVGDVYTFIWCRGPGDHGQGVGRLVALGPDPAAPAEPACTFELLMPVFSVEGRAIDSRRTEVAGTVLAIWTEDLVTIDAVSPQDQARLADQAMVVARLAARP